MKTIIHHLENTYTEPVRDPLWGHIYLSPLLKKIIQQPEFLRLGRIKQLGPAYLVYPGATHTRLSHSLGVFHLAKRILGTLLSHHTGPDLTREGSQAFLLAALLHDLGHFPYAHTCQDLPLTDHETLGARLIQDSSITPLLRDAGIDPAFTAAIIDETLEPGGDSKELFFYRSLLSGVLDPDKLDYLNRDAYFCGVPYGIQDIDFVISQIAARDYQGLTLPIKGVSAIENILFSKYLMYKTVYWHRDVRYSSLIAERAVRGALEEQRLSPQQLYAMDDQQFSRFFLEHSHPRWKHFSDWQRPEMYATLEEIPFYEENHLSRGLEQPAVRESLASAIADQLDLPSQQILVDLPPAINFEVDLTIRSRTTPSCSFRHGPTVFSPPVVQGFTESLRILRLGLPADSLKEAKQKGVSLTLDSTTTP